MFCPSGRLKLGLTCQDSKIGQNYAQTWVNWVTVTGLTIAVTLRLYIDQADLRNTSLIRWLDCEWFSGIDKYWAERLSSKSGISNRQKNCWVPGGSVPASPSLKVLSEIFAPTKPIPTISPYPNFLGTFHDRDFFFIVARDGQGRNFHLTEGPPSLLSEVSVPRCVDLTS